MLFKLAMPLIPSIVLVALLTTVVILLLILLAQSYFNTSELNALVDGAANLGKNYEIVIHNQLTNSYNFNIID